jgi:hypothetical protein
MKFLTGINPHPLRCGDNSLYDYPGAQLGII